MIAQATSLAADNEQRCRTEGPPTFHDAAPSAQQSMPFIGPALGGYRSWPAGTHRSDVWVESLTSRHRDGSQHRHQLTWVQHTLQTSGHEQRCRHSNGRLHVER
jgi:hypothetical protein